MPTDVTGLDGLSIRVTAESITDDGLRESRARLVPAGSVLLTSRATIGCTAIAAVAMAINQGFANLIWRNGLLPEYLAVWLRLRRGRLVELAGGATFKEMSKTTLRKLQIPVPPVEVQRQFGKFVGEIYAVSSAATSSEVCNGSLKKALASRLLAAA